MLRRGVLALVLLLCALTSNPIQASLIGTDLSVQVVFKTSPTSPPVDIGFLTTARVVNPGIEFPDLSKTQQNNNTGYSIVPVSVDAGADFLKLQILPSAGSGFFAPTFFNGYVFTFSSAALADITGARIDPSTTLGITSPDVTFSGNNLFLNVEGLTFNRSSFVRIDLTVVGGPPQQTPVPEPGTLSLFGGAAGLLLLACAWRRRKVPHRPMAGPA